MLSMCGPKYAGVNDQCKYNPQTERVESVALMNGPVFKGVESSNKYGIMPPKVEGEAPMTGPVYPNVASASQYNPVGDKQVGPVEMLGPKYPGIVESHSYGPVGVRVKGELAVTGPVYPADPANKFSIVPERRSGQPILAGPAYHGVEAKNQYNPQVGFQFFMQLNPKFIFNKLLLFYYI